MIELLAAVAIATFDCEVQPPQILNVDRGTPALSVIGLPAELQRWKFAVQLLDGNPIRAQIDWPGNPIQAAGNFPAVATSDASYAFTAFSSGPCLFTEKACLTQFNLVEQGNGKATIIITPSAISNDRDKGQRIPFLAVIQGQCIRADKK